MELNEGGQAEWKRLAGGRDGLWPVLRSAVGGLVAAAGVVLILAAAVVLGLQDQSLVAGAVSTATASVTPSPLPATRPQDVSTRSSVRPSPTQTQVAATVTKTPLPSPTQTPSASPTPVPPTFTPTVPPSATPTQLMRTSQTHRSTPTATARSRCTPNPPQGWQRYTVKKGESLSRLANRFGVTMRRLMSVNCLSGVSIRPQQKLWVPYLAPAKTRKPAPTRKPKPTATEAEPTPDGEPTPYGSGVLVPPELSGESPLPSTSAPARMLSGAATVLSLALMAMVRLAASRREFERQREIWPYGHGLHGYAPREQHEAGSLSR